MASPRPRIDASDTFFLGRRRIAKRSHWTRDPRNHNLFLLTDGEMDLDRLGKARRWVRRPCREAWRSAVLAYSGIAVKMLVDQRLDAQLHTMFMVDYQPGACATRTHPFEESYYMLEGEVDVVADGGPSHAPPLATSSDRYRLVRVLRDPRRDCAMARDIGAGPSLRHSVPARVDWNYLLELVRRRRRCDVSHVSDKPHGGRSRRSRPVLRSTGECC